MSPELTTPVKIEIPGIGTIESADLYLKVEADKVIAELEEKLKNSRNARKYWRNEYLIEYKECCHNKHKRCLAMAMWCAAERDIFNLTPKVAKVKLYKRRHKRWLELAEKFKEAK